MQQIGLHETWLRQRLKKKNRFFANLKLGIILYDQQMVNSKMLAMKYKDQATEIPCPRTDI